MSPEKQREIARLGGAAAHARGVAHRFSADEARAAGRKGGQSVSQDRDHMSDIGRRGGETVSQDRDHMSDIGREGGRSRGQRAEKRQRGGTRRAS
jgi:general stress protein YciG